MYRDEDTGEATYRDILISSPRAESRRSWSGCIHRFPPLITKKSSSDFPVTWTRVDLSFDTRASQEMAKDIYRSGRIPDDDKKY